MHLYLIGFRGTGKSQVARALGTLLDMEVVDLDQAICDASGQSIRAIFQQHGEHHFRELESKCLTSLARQPPLVISTGGGVVTLKSNREWIKQTGLAVWLKASPEVIFQRITSDDANERNRPPLTEMGLREEIDCLLEQRQPIYAKCADYRIDTDVVSIVGVAEQIANWWATADKHQ